MKARISLEERIATAQQLAIRSRAFFEIWHQYWAAEHRRVIHPTMTMFMDFFRFAEYMPMVAFSVFVTNLFDPKRDDVVSLSALVRELRTLGAGAKLDSIQSAIDAAEPVAVKVRKLRNKVYAHRDSEMTPEEVYELVGLRPSEMDSISLAALKIADDIALAHGIPDMPYDLFNVRADMTRMFAALARGTKGMEDDPEFGTF